MDDRRKFDSGTKWEPIVGYSRAVKDGDFIYVAGTTATDAKGQIIGIGNASAQTEQAIQNIKRALEALGSSLADVVRTRLYVTDITSWEEIGRVHGKFFETIRPATTMVEVKGLVNPQMLVEVEAEAIVSKRKD